MHQLHTSSQFDTTLEFWCHISEFSESSEPLEAWAYYSFFFLFHLTTFNAFKIHTWLFAFSIFLCLIFFYNVLPLLFCLSRSWLRAPLLTNAQKVFCFLIKLQLNCMSQSLSLSHSITSVRSLCISCSSRLNSTDIPSPVIAITFFSVCSSSSLHPSLSPSLCLWWYLATL